MREITAKHRDGFRIRSLIESAVIVETISDLRRKGFESFVIKTVTSVKPEEYQQGEGFQWLSPN